MKEKNIKYFREVIGIVLLILFGIALIKMIPTFASLVTEEGRLEFETKIESFGLKGALFIISLNIGQIQVGSVIQMESPPQAWTSYPALFNNKPTFLKFSNKTVSFICFYTLFFHSCRKKFWDTKLFIICGNPSPAKQITHQTGIIVFCLFKRQYVL